MADGDGRFSLGLHYFLLLTQSADSNYGAQWPPEDPVAYNDDHTFTLPADPWTYGNGTLNPNLQPSDSSRLRERGSRKGEPTFALPPYHPDYKEPATDDEGSHGSDDGYWDQPAPPPRLVRRGSEGYEVRPVDREELLRIYVAEQTHTEGRYNFYEPEPPSGGESDYEDEDDHVKVD